QFLDAVGEPVFEEAAVIGRRLGIEQLAPAGLQGLGVHGFEGPDLGQDGLAHLLSPSSLATAPLCRASVPSKKSAPAGEIPLDFRSRRRRSPRARISATSSSRSTVSCPRSMPLSMPGG